MARPPKLHEPLAALVALLLLAFAAVGCRSPGNSATAAGVGRVVEVFDGDTILIEIGGARETVRLLGIDAPETHHPTRPVECFGAEATARLAELTPPGTEVRVERDVEARDAYGRLLLYVYRSSDGLFVNEALVAEGYATTLYVEPNGVHRSTLDPALAGARSAGRGLWGACGGPDVAVDQATSR